MDLKTQLIPSTLQSIFLYHFHNPMQSENLYPEIHFGIDLYTADLLVHDIAA